MKRIVSFLLTLCLTLSLCACGQKAATETAPTWQDQYDLGVRYLSEGNYEEAIIAFTVAIEIDPKRPEAYLDMAYAYIGQNDFDAARDILEKGYELTQDADLKAKLDELDSGNITDYVGNVCKMSSYDADGDLVYYHTYTYDSHGRKSSATSFDSTGHQTGHVDITYNSAGQSLADYYSLPTSGEIRKTENEYNANGKCVRETLYGHDNEPWLYRIFTYDAQGHQTNTDQYSADGKLEYYYFYSYDAQGNLTRQENYDADGRLEDFLTYARDAQGRALECCWYRGDSTLYQREIYIRDDEGNMIGLELYDGEGNLVSSDVYE